MKRNGSNSRNRGSDRQVPFHTLVAHVSPDLESCACVWLLQTYPELAKRIGTADGELMLKFIPAGPLRSQDWPGHRTVTVEALSRQGYAFLDVAGGEFDHHPHGRSQDGQEQSTLDIILAKSGADVVLPHLVQAFRKITANDLEGTEVVCDTERNSSPTPHTSRQLRNIILGWNLLHRTAPQAVMAQARLAYCGIAALAASAVRGSLAKDLSAAGLSDSDIQGVEMGLLVGLDTCLGDGDVVSQEAAYGQLFLAKNIVAGVGLYLADAVAEGELTDEQAAQALVSFRQSVDSALATLETEWHHGEDDYWSPATKVHELKRRIPTGRGVVSRDCCLVVGTSTSVRYSATTRRGNCGSNRPHPDQEVRSKADVTIQFAPNGRFVVSSRYIKLDKIAAVIREKDLEAKGVDTTRIEVGTLRQIGHLDFRSRDGRKVEALLLAYDKAFGNNFRANPNGPDCALSPDQVVRLVIWALQNPI